MFKSFNLKTKDDFSNYDQYINNRFDEMKTEVETNLNEYLCPNGNINATKIQNDWFPALDADIFISHSHDDENLAKNFAGWLYEELGLVSFIDSCVWGYANNILKCIDQEYSKSDFDQGYYDYEKRNFSTSHVHMMLSTALTKMMDKTECVIFLNTSNSTIEAKNEDIVKNKLFSPWIYNEIVMTKFLRERLPEEREQVLKSLNEKYEFSQKKYTVYEYDAEFDHLIYLDDNDLSNWKNFKKTNVVKNSLDALYAIKNIELNSR